MLKSTGVPTTEDIKTVTPSDERFAKGPVSIVECYQKIPCNPCVKSCPQKAITMATDINDLPEVDFDLCNGCSLCVSRCPGLAIFIVDKTYSETEALVKLPFEYIPLPKEGQLAKGLDRDGNELGWFPVKRVQSGGKKNKTYVITLVVPQELAMEVRNIAIGGYKDE